MRLTFDILQVLGSLLKKKLAEDTLLIGQCINKGREYSILCWDEYSDENVSLLYNGDFYLNLSYWDDHGINREQNYMLAGSALDFIPEGLKNMMAEAFAQKKHISFRTNTLT